MVRKSVAGVRELADRLLEEVAAYGLAEPSTRTYRTICRAIVRFAGESCGGSWSEGLVDRYMEHVDRRLADGEIKPKYHRMQRRVLRMLASLAETGEADFSRASHPIAKYPVSEEAADIVGSMLEDASLSDDAKGDLRAPIRHLIWYASERGVDPLGIDDDLVMSFLIDEVPSSNGSSTGLALRAVSLAVRWLSSHGNQRLLRDYSQLTLRGPGHAMVPAYTEAEIAAMVGAADGSTPKGLRDKAIVLLAYCTGLRGRDVLRLKLSDVDWRRGRITVSQSKTHQTITCALNGETMNALADYVLRGRPECAAREVFVTATAPHRPLTRGITGIVDALCERAGVAKVARRSSHSLRRSFETVMVARGVPIETASQMMGHRGIEYDKPYITYDSIAAAHVALGLDEAPILAGAYRAGEGVASHDSRREA